MGVVQKFYSFHEKKNSPAQKSKIPAFSFRIPHSTFRIPDSVPAGWVCVTMDLTDEQWQLIEPMLAAPVPAVRPRVSATVGY